MSGEESFTIGTEQQGVRAIISPIGEINYRTCITLREQVQKLMLPSVLEIVIDLGGVGFIDSTGIGTIIGLKSGCQGKSKRLVLRNLQPQVDQAFRVMKLDRVFPFEKPS